MEIQLIIRAPNQNIEDQVIECNLNWTILRLKNHLSNVYPNKPIVKEQKLIYSGRLLHDHLQLKDIIRYEDSQSTTHILHLVCNGKNNFSSQNPNSSQKWSNHSVPIQSNELNTRNTGSFENVLRHRPQIASSETNNSQMQFQEPVNTFPQYPNDPEVWAQMAAMQQMYAQYLSQYWQSINLAAATGNPPAIPVIANIQPQQINPNNVAEETPAQHQANQRINAPAGQVVEDNEFANRDWLDQIFLYFRFLILLSIIYFYTTPERFMLVIVIIVIAFLYHEGWFVRQGIAEAVRGQRHRVNAEPNPNAANNNVERPLSNENEAHDGHDLEAAMDGEEPPHAQNPDVVNNNQVFSPLTLLATFFSSLIPEPPPPVNIN